MKRYVLDQDDVIAAIEFADYAMDARGGIWTYDGWLAMFEGHMTYLGYKHYDDAECLCTATDGEDATHEPECGMRKVVGDIDQYEDDEPVKER